MLVDILRAYGYTFQNLIVFLMKVLDEAITVHGAKLIITYHPRPFGKFNK